ncbi:hypothetical protein P153DRAFT_429386 [Dothidotthia symphoricarpi CBS 119687]|uniref:Uncharacterized protein n=1 Tax=Dothidotthia symphoricarpi CBS 119687 TaxID=1392245 RepID=A0A6A6AKW4_9PLEO|nr:uncharacterized protein P153DRAFT_429386 [Dothidotthia symphoricarpi CBS 119687]KAF2132206.1 hypothetical protein P153DRAFT_429386 [Dothidotthia symphoricarpi CBS 119687]
MPSYTAIEPISNLSPSDNNISHRSEATSQSAEDGLDSIPLADSTTRRGQIRNDSAYTLLKPHSDTDTAPSAIPPTLQKPFCLHHSTWLYEILSLVLAAFTLVGFMIVLAVYDRKPSPVVGGITLNTVASFAATLFSMCLMVPVHNCLSQLGWTWLGKDYKSLNDLVEIDWASRGPWGSLQLLPRFLRSPLISVAATITIMSVGIGPFFQQSVVFHNTQVVNDELTAYASAALTYDGDVGEVGSEYMVGSSFLRMQADNVPFNLKASIYTGIYSSAIIAPPFPPYSCPSGNCTWDPFPTLGVSVQCLEDSSRYHINCSDTTLFSWDNSTYKPCFMEAIDPEFRTANRTAPQYDVLTLDRFFDHVSPFEPFKYPDARYNASYSFSETPKLGTSSVASGFTEIGWQIARNLTVPPSSMYSSAIASSSTIEAHRCIFYLSMHEILARVQNGVYSEQTLSETTKLQSLKNLEGAAPAPWTNETRLITDPDTMTFTYTPTCLSSNQCIHGDTAPRNITIKEYIYQSILAATAASEVFELQGISTFGQNGLQGPESLQLLYRSPNITKTMYTVAQYINLALRSNDTTLHKQDDPGNSTKTPADYVAPSHRISGLVFVQAVQLRVRWPWLAFPIALIVAVIALLVGTIVASRHDKVGVWKNNPLAVLLNTAWRPDTDDMGAATSDGLEKLAKGLEARVVLNREHALADTRRVIEVREKRVAAREASP